VREPAGRTGWARTRTRTRTRTKTRTKTRFDLVGAAGCEILAGFDEARIELTRDAGERGWTPAGLSAGEWVDAIAYEVWADTGACDAAFDALLATADLAGTPALLAYVDRPGRPSDGYGGSCTVGVELVDGPKVLEVSAREGFPMPAKPGVPGRAWTPDELAWTPDERAWLQPLVVALDRSTQLTRLVEEFHARNRSVCDWKLSQWVVHTASRSHIGRIKPAAVDRALKRNGQETIVLLDVDGSEALPATCKQDALCGTPRNCASRLLSAAWAAEGREALPREATRPTTIQSWLHTEFGACSECGMPLWDERFDLWHLPDAVNAAFGGRGGILQGLLLQLAAAGEWSAVAASTRVWPCFVVPHEDDGLYTDSERPTCHECAALLFSGQDTAPCLSKKAAEWMSNPASDRAMARAKEIAQRVGNALVASLRIRMAVSARSIRHQLEAARSAAPTLPITQDDCQSLGCWF
jgi:hypothetical protein